MKKIILITGMVFVLILIVSHGLYAQRYYRYGPGTEDDYYDLNLTREQIEAIDKLELELEKEISPLINKLRSNYRMLDELEEQRSPDQAKIDDVYDMIFGLEDDIQNKEIEHEKKIRDLLTEDQRAIFDSYYAYCTNFYGRGGFGRGYRGLGFRGFRGGVYGYGGYCYGAGRGRNYLGRSAGRWNRGYYGYGRGISKGYGRNMGYFGRGTRQFGYSNNRILPGIRYGRGPCGAGLGRWYRWDYRRGSWNWDK
jgi:Spy/CpxP family protein refolding chaperone